MIRIFCAACLAVLLGVSGAEADHKKGHAAPETPKKAADQTPDLLNDPMAVPKWFGSAVDDILTGTSRALSPPDSSKK